MATPAPVLDLTTDRTRPMVRIDHVDYPLRTSNDLTLDAYKTLERIAPRIGALLLLETLTAEQGSELSQLLDQACRLGLVAPESVHDTLGDVHRLSLFQVFTELLTPSLVRAARVAAISQASHSRGLTPSPDSSGSIPAAATKTGPRARRSASSGRA